MPWGHGVSSDGRTMKIPPVAVLSVATGTQHTQLVQQNPKASGLLECTGKVGFAPIGSQMTLCTAGTYSGKLCRSCFHYHCLPFSLSLSTAPWQAREVLCCVLRRVDRTEAGDLRVMCNAATVCGPQLLQQFLSGKSRSKVWKTHFTDLCAGSTWGAGGCSHRTAGTRHPHGRSMGC